MAMRQIIPGVALLLVGTQSLLATVFFAALRSAFDSLRPGAGAAWTERDRAAAAPRTP
jgi:hypothetical protein